MARKRRSKPADDPVVSEVRRIRARIWRDAGGTPEGLIKLLDERQSSTKTSRPRRSRKKSSA